MDGPADLNDVVRENLELMADLLGPGIQVVTELSPEPAWLPAERCDLERILGHLLTNAREAMAEGDQVTVRTAYLRQGHPPVPAPAVLLQVEDTGIGMGDQVQKLMFEPYFTTKPGGAGLGLPIVAQLVRENGGWMGVTSQPGRGTRFDIVLPGLRSSVR